LSLEELYRGATKEFSVQRQVVCKNCDGKGGTETRLCQTCGGMGQVVRQHRVGPMVQMIQTECPDCGGAGYVIPQGKECKPCGGHGVMAKEERLTFTVPPGARGDFQQRFPRLADEIPGADPGDLIFRVEELRHHLFKRVGDDLILQKTLPLQDALCGFRFRIRFLDGQDLVIESISGGAEEKEQKKKGKEGFDGDSDKESSSGRSGSSSETGRMKSSSGTKNVHHRNQVVQPNDLWRVPQRGMPNSNGQFGDLVIKFEVLMPQSVIPDRSLFAKLGLERSFYLPDTDLKEEEIKENGGRLGKAENMGTRQKGEFRDRIYRQAERQERTANGGGNNGEGCHVM